MDRIAVLGGGAFVPALCEALAGEARLGPLEIRVAARRRDRLDVIAGHAARRVAGIRGDMRVKACDSVAEAAEGARVVVILIRVGGLAARAYDEAFPRLFGLTGDEGLGPGGIANAYRTLPVLTDMARTLRTCAPDAMVLNLVAPLGLTTRLLLDEGVGAVGLCELPLVTLERMAAAAGVAADAVDYRYGGLNHLGWFWDVRAEGVDVMAAAGRQGLVDGDTFRRFGAAPLPYYYDVFAHDAAERLGRSRDPARARVLEALSERLVERYAGAPGERAPEAERRPTPWFDRAVVPFVTALVAGKPTHGFANVQNGELWQALPKEAIVEVEAWVAGDGVHPVPVGAMPKEAARFVATAARAEEVAYRAARERKRTLVEEAVLALPLGIAAAEAAEMARWVMGARTTE